MSRARTLAAVLTGEKILPDKISDSDNSSTGYFAVPHGSLNQRPATATAGQFRFNTSSNALEYYNDTNWVALGLKTGGTAANAASTASILYSNLLATNGSVTDGVYWLNPPNAPQPFLAYVDFSTPNGPWVHVGTALGNTRGLWTVSTTWYSRTTDYGSQTDPYNTSSSNFNAGSFIYCKGNDIMIKYSTTGYVQASGFNQESWRDVYSFLSTRTAYPSQPSYQRELTITSRGGVVTSSAVQGAGLLYGTDYTSSGVYTHWYVYGFDAAGDTFAYLSTGTYNSSTSFQGEADIGIGANERGPNENAFPGDAYSSDAAAFDAGSNSSQAGAGEIFNAIPFSLWIKN